MIESYQKNKKTKLGGALCSRVVDKKRGGEAKFHNVSSGGVTLELKISPHHGYV